MNFEKELPRHPQFPCALNINDLEPGMDVSVLCSVGRVVVSGVVEQGPDYDGDEWSSFTITAGDKQSIDLSAYEMGLVCDRHGDWSALHVEETVR